MRPLVTGLALVALLTIAPTVPADRETGSTTGMNGGYVQVGLWDVYYYDKTAGTSTANIELTWTRGLLPGADYDLHLYKPGALADGVLERHELLAASETRSFTTMREQITPVLPEGKYVVAVIPWQAQEERYALDATPGWLNPAAVAPGIQFFCPISRCPLP